MNTVRSFVIIVTITLLALPEMILGSPSGVVGYDNTELRFGNNRVDIRFDAINPLFSTLDMVLSFEPVNGVLGDEIEFSLDGKLRRYCFSSYNGTNYVLSAARTGLPPTLTLDAIPWMPVFWIRHNSTNKVFLAQAGGAGGKYARMESSNRNDDRSAEENQISVTIVDNDDALRPKRINLKGGHLSITASPAATTP